MTREQVYGRRPVREALRGPREVLELWATERAVASEPWLADGPRVHVKPDREIGEAAETRDHQGVLAWCEPYRYADAHELAAVERPLLACLDQVTDPRNLGAVIRSAEGAGATGVVVPAHGSARVTAAVCRASAGAVEHLPVAVVPNLARYLNEIKRGDLWIYAASAEAEQDLWTADLTGGLALVFGAEGKGVRPLVRRACDATVSIPLAGKVESLNVSVAAALLLYEARRQARWLSRRCISSTATTCCTRARSTGQRELTDVLASFVAMRGARGVLVWDGVGVDAEIGALSVRFASHADAVLERLAAEHRDTEVVCLVSSDFAVQGTSGQAVQKRSSGAFLGDLEQVRHAEPHGTRLGDSLDDETRERLERMRRGQS